MSTFICEKCGCIDNSACGGTYWSGGRGRNYYKNQDDNDLKLCVECKVGEFKDGTFDDRAGKWHDLFPKQHWTEYGTKEEIIEESDKQIGNVVNTREYFERNENGKTNKEEC